MCEIMMPLLLRVARESEGPHPGQTYSTVGQGRRMRCCKPAPCSRSSCMRFGSYRRGAAFGRRCNGRVGMGSCFIGKAREVWIWVWVWVLVVMCRWCRRGVSRAAAGTTFPWLAALHSGRYAGAISSHPMHHRQPSSPLRPKTAHSRLETASARFVSSLTSRWLGPAWPAWLLQRWLLASSPAARETFPRPPDYCAHASQGSTERRPSNSCACACAPASTAGTSVRTLARLTLRCMHGRSSRPASQPHRGTDGLLR